MFTEMINLKCQDEIHYVCIISMVGDSHWEVFLKTVVSNFWKYKVIYSLQIYHSLWKIHMKEFTILVCKWTKKFILKTDLQKELIVKKHSWRRRFSILLLILSIIVSVISYSHIWTKKSEKVSDNLSGKMFFK